MPRRGRRHRREARFEHRGGGEEQAAVGLQHDHLAGGSSAGRRDLDHVAVGVDDAAHHRHLVGLAHHVEHDREGRRPPAPRTAAGSPS